jgi:ubiquinone biosynthesis protein
MEGIFTNLMNVMIKHNIVLPREFVMIGRGLILLEDSGSRLDPAFNLTGELEKFAKKMIGEKFSTGNIVHGGLNYIVEIEHLLKDLPDKLNSTLNKLEEGELEVNLKHNGLDDLKNMISLSLILAALIVGTALVLAATIVASSLFKTTTGLPIDYVYMISLAGFIISIVLGIYIVFKYLRN